MSQIIEMPTSSCAAQTTVTINRVVGRTASPFTLQEQSFWWGGEQWLIDFSLPNIVSKEIAAEWRAFATSLRGSYNYFLLGDMSARLPVGTAQGNAVLAVNGETGNTISTAGWTPDQPDLLRAGDYIQIDQGINSRLYMVVENASSDADGEAQLKIEPSLRVNTVLNVPITVTNPRGVFRLAQNSFSWGVSTGLVHSFSFQAAEVINA